MLVPRGGAWGARVAADARARGLTPLVVPLIDDAPPADPGPFDAAVAALVAGRYTWLVVTSATAVWWVGGRVSGLPGGTRVAAVGPATAAACAALGWPVDVMPEDASAADLVAAVPDTTGRVLFPRSDLAAPTLPDGLRARGLDVDDVEAYRTVGTGTGPLALDAPPDAVLVTSGSVARQVAARLAPLDPTTCIACIGPRTAADARAAGLPVTVVARHRSVAALLDAVVAHLDPSANPNPPGR